MVRVNTIPESKRRRKQRLLAIILSIVFLSATGIGLVYWCPPSLQDIGGKAISFVGKLSQSSAGTTPAEPVLRGSIYDRNMEELAVSYRLFSLTAHPSEIKKREKTAEVLSDILGTPQEKVADDLKSHKRVITLAENLDQQQVAEVQRAGLDGIYCTPVEVRFYPSHTSGAQVLGFADQGVGLYGVEGKFDAVLQPGEFRNSSVAQIDFKQQEVLGKSSTDVVLTMDIELQRLLDKHFRTYLEQQDAAKGMAVLIEPFTGRIIAVMSQPTFNPNYYWQADENVQVNRVYRHKLSKQLLQPLLNRAAAIERDGLQKKAMLPLTVSSPDYGLDNQARVLFDYKLKLFEPVFESWVMAERDKPGVRTVRSGPRDTLTGAQIATAVASLVNGGWRISPYILDGIYDHKSNAMYRRREGGEFREHVLEPAAGIVLRRKLFTGMKGKKKEESSVAALELAVNNIKMEDGLSTYTRQELFVGMVPKNMPKYLLVMAVDNERLDPLPAVSGKKRVSLEGVGKLVLHRAIEKGEQQFVSHPSGKSEENFRRFLISRRLDYREPYDDMLDRPGQMPEILGLSLRKGLQRLNQHQVMIKIHGTGTIVAQVPAPGQPVAPGHECVLTLRPEI